MSEQLKQMREIGFVPLVVLEDEAAFRWQRLRFELRRL